MVIKFTIHISRQILTMIQVFVNRCIKEMLNSVTIEPNSVQRIADEYQVTLVGIYGIAGHSKNEVDCCGRVVKIRVRREVSRGKCFKTADDSVSFLNEHFKDNSSQNLFNKID